MSVAAARRGAEAAGPTWLERLYAALPVVTVFVWLCLVYAWQSWGHKTPWLFSDELELTQVSRAIAETGRAARRGEPHWFQSLFAFFLAPAWLIGQMSRAYATAKYIGVVTMTSVVFPTYLLARTLVSSRTAALFAAAAAASVPALAYAPMMLEEPLAYPFATLSFFLIVKALVERTRGWIAVAVAASLVAPLIRGELALVPVVFLLAALTLLWLSERARRWRETWSARDWVGAIVLVIGVVIFCSALIGSQSTSWRIATGYYRGRMIDYGLWAAGALTIGLGVLPIVAGLAALFRPRSEPRTPAFRAFAAVFAASAFCFGLYTAVKASYLSTVFATRISERNLIYLAPLLLIATSLWLDRPRLRIVPLAAATGFAAYLIVSTPYELDVKLYSDALGLSILQMANSNLGFTPTIAQWTLVAVLVISVALLLLPRLLAGRRRAVAGVLALTAGLVLAWNLAGAISAGDASNTFSSQFRSNLPDPPDWAEQVTKGAHTMYLGQNILDPNGVWLLEFWNPSIRYIWSLDGTAPGPGPTVTPDIDGLDGHLQQQRGDVQYVVADEGIDVLGTVAARGRHFAAGAPADWRLVRIDYPVRLRTAVEGVYADGWMGHRASYTYFSSAGKRPGYALVSVSRAAWGGKDVPGRVRITVGTLALKGAHPVFGKVTATCTWTVHSLKSRKFAIPTPTPPFRVEVTITPTFVPAEIDPRTGDRRALGAVVGFGFIPKAERSC